MPSRELSNARDRPVVVYRWNGGYNLNVIPVIVTYPQRPPHPPLQQLPLQIRMKSRI